jgi:phosphoglycolate phosphatase
MRYKTIIWDWNGTLLNDIEASLKSVNKILADNNMELLNRDSYREVFGFPVKSYYEKVGFDFEKQDWDSVAYDYINTFISEMPYTKLFDDAQSTLEDCKTRGVKHYILSAMEHKQLLKDVDRQGLNKYFEAIYGIGDIYAFSKLELGVKFLSENTIDKASTIMIGDTIHDYELALSMGIDCILYAKGHQNRARLEATNCPFIVESLKEIAEIL